MSTPSPLTREELLSCVELGKALTAQLDARQLFQTILHKISELLPAETWSLLLLDEEAGELRFELSVDLDIDLVKDVRLPIGEGIAGQAALHQRPMIIEDVGDCEFFSKQVDDLSGCVTQSVICVPLVFGGKTLGVIEVVNPRSLDNRALPLLSIIADYAAIAVENMRRYGDIENLAVHDDLTGLYNTRYLYGTLSDLLPKGDVNRDALSLIFMDMDNFKNIVDTYGHLKGSQALQEVARTIRECLPQPAFGVAYGGDEFVAVLPGFEKEQAILKAEEIRSRMCQTIYLADHGHNVSLEASFGIATYPKDATDMRSLLALADKAMFHAKKKGRGTIGSA